MIMKHNIIFLIGVVCLMASCSRDEFGDFRPEPTPGEEVRFSANVVGDSQTKTLYGADQPDSIMVKWVNGDLISVYGKTGGNQVAEYKVVATTNPTNTPNVDNGQVYADDLQKTAVSGVQWGDEEAANFMAIYPSTGASFPSENQIKTTISATQNYVFPSGYHEGVLSGVDAGGADVSIDLWEGTHFGSNATNPSMQNAIMFARTENVANGSTVDLHFKPFATVLKFRFMGFNSSLSDPTIYVQNITVTAPDGTNISGDFTLTISGSAKDATAKAVASGNNTNSITLNTILPGGGFIPLKKHQAIDFNVFTIPLDNVKMGGDVTKKIADGKATYSCEYPWKIEVKTAQHGTFTYNIIPKVENLNTLQAGTHEAQEFTLAKGEIHKVKIPQLTVMGTVDWDYSRWMTYIPKPVYLSELSIPGTWYSTNSAYQNTTDLEKQYNAGVRAFNIDCRMSPSSFEKKLFGSAVYGELELICAGTDKWGTGGPNAASSLYNPYTRGTSVLSTLSKIASCIKDDEYVVVVLTVAEKPLTSSDIVYGGATVDPSIVIPAITSMLNTNATALKLYTNKITKDTTVEDVLGHMIVKVNSNSDDFVYNVKPELSNTTYTYPSYSLNSFASMAMKAWNSTDDNITDLASSYYIGMNTEEIFWANKSTDLTFYYHQCQRTVNDGVSVDGVPTIQDRKDAISDIVDKSTQIYDASDHNGWFQLGIGGYIDDGGWGDNADQAAISTALNKYVQALIEEKMASDPSPVGLVLMNHATDANGNSTQIVKDIIEMNGKFYLKREGGNVTTGDGTNQGTTPQPVPASNAAYAVVGGDAF